MCLVQKPMPDVKLLLDDILVHCCQQRYLRDACNSFGNGYFVLTEEGASVPAPLTKGGSLSGGSLV